MSLKNNVPIRGLLGNQYSDFFEWCYFVGFKDEKEIITNLPWTPPTLRNWLKTNPEKILPFYMDLFCLGFEDNINNKIINPNERVSFIWFEDWRSKLSKNTFEEIGGIFGISKQAVNNWYIRGNLPIWLPYACLGLKIKKNKKNLDE